ncbi:hypothetical protein [Vibrio sp. 99-8-1]|uniref:hypothetical protein n=1 Tax=Vibrio sp. 99-8-1 TaxID=2607602 RepID=UPI001493D89F|nr:hypothetical protein [Vibrio sp. 99-8-1]NOI66904.1 hypothetical protein [Vibrio sp. 99-8-1]
MKLKQLALFFLLALMASKSMGNTSKDICNSLKPEVSVLQEQLPIRIDYVTSLIGVQAIYLSSTCLINYNYLVDTEVYVKDVSKHAGLTMEESIEWLKTDEAYASMKENFTVVATGAVDSTMTELKKYKGIKILFNYSFDDLSITPVIATGFDSTGEK